jgi:C4-dicarboxylate transporter, DctQ subunit
MRLLIRLYDGIIVTFAALAGAVIAFIFVAVIYDAVLRDVGLQPTRWAEPLSQIGLLYVTMLSAPWILRSKGQIVVETLRKPLPTRAQFWLERAVYLLCITVSAVMTWSSAIEARDAFQRGDVERLAIYIPSYLYYLPLVAGFFLLGCEFLRLLVGGDSLYMQDPTSRDSI